MSVEYSNINEAKTFLDRSGTSLTVNLTDSCKESRAFLSGGAATLSLLD